MGKQPRFVELLQQEDKASLLIGFPDIEQAIKAGLILLARLFAKAKSLEFLQGFSLFSEPCLSLPH